MGTTKSHEHNKYMWCPLFFHSYMWDMYILLSYHIIKLFWEIEASFFILANISYNNIFTNYVSVLIVHMQ